MRISMVESVPIICNSLFKLLVEEDVPEEERLRCTGTFVNTFLQVGDSDSIEYKHALIPDY